MAKVSRTVDKILDSMERDSNLSREGRDWLIAACDPFHDHEMALSGYPDVLTASTVVQLVKKQLQITVPTTGNGAVAAGANWDCHITLLPNAIPNNLQGFSQVDPFFRIITSTTTTNNLTFGCLSVQSCPSGGNTFPAQAGIASVSSQSLAVNEFINGNCRIIGMAFEVVNTTAEINKQGQVLVYRLPNTDTVTSVFASYATTPLVVSATTIRASRFPPANIAQAQLLYGTRSWAASEGAYVVSRQSGLDNPINQPTALPLTYLTTDVTPGSNTFVYSNSNLLTTAGQNWPDLYSPFDISGAYFTGLSYSTTLTVNVRWLIERMPGPYESDLVVLATPSAPFDPLALELYTHCLRDMPPGVMLKENPLGEWFRSALAGVADLAPRVGRALNLPGSAMIGQGIGAIASSLGRNRLDPRPLPGSASNIVIHKGIVETANHSNKQKEKPKKKKVAVETVTRRFKN